MNYREKIREKISVSLDKEVLESLREIMKTVQRSRVELGKKPTSLSRVLEAALVVDLEDAPLVQETAEGFAL